MICTKRMGHFGKMHLEKKLTKKPRDMWPTMINNTHPFSFIAECLSTTVCKLGWTAGHLLSVMKVCEKERRRVSSGCVLNKTWHTCTV